MRFPKAARLRRTSEFHTARTKGRALHGRLMILNVLRSGDATAPTRVGIITSHRVGNAVKRNRLRRLIREIFRRQQPRFEPGCWQIVVLRSRACGVSLATLEEEWLRLAAQASILRAAW